MSGNKNALVLLWTGNSISDEMVKRIAEYLTTNGICVPELLKAKFYDQDGINNVLVKDLSDEGITPQVIVGTHSNNIAPEAVKNAIIYIGERFKDALSNPNEFVFTLELYDAVRKAKDSIGFNILSAQHAADMALLNAVEILATTKARIPLSFAKKYHITQNVIDIIICTYKQIG